MTWVKILELIKLPPRLVGWFFVCSGILLWAPTKWHQFFHLEEAIKAAEIYIGVVFVGSGVLLLIDLCKGLAVAIHGTWANRKRARRAEEIVGKLDHAEQAILREFYLQGKNTISVPIGQHTVAGLIQKGMLVVVSQERRILMVGVVFPVKIASHFLGYVTPEIVGFGEKVKGELVVTPQMKKVRPRFIGEIQRDENRRHGY